MATFISTVLAKRTGATTTTFTPTGISGGVANFRAPATLAWYGPYLTASQFLNGIDRRTKVRVGIPQMSTDGLMVRARPYGEISMFVPEGTLQTDVNDLVGYMNALTATGLTNFNDILVAGSGVY